MSLIKDTYEEVSEYLGSKIYKEVRELLEKAKRYNEEQKLFENTMKNSPIIEFPPEIIYCRDCIHRPFKEYSEIQAPKINGLTDYTCPFVCVDSYYTIIPDNDFFCKNGERE